MRSGTTYKVFKRALLGPCLVAASFALALNFVPHAHADAISLSTSDLGALLQGNHEFRTYQPTLQFPNGQYPDGPSTPSGISVDYAVFAPGSFDHTALDPTASFAYSDTDYVYAYQVINATGLNVGDFSVHFDSQKLADPIIDSVGEADPNHAGNDIPFISLPYATIANLPGNDSTSFFFSGLGIAAGQNSEFIFEASQYAPDGNLGAGQQPSYITPPSYNYAYLPAPWSSSGGANATVGTVVPLPAASVQGIAMLGVIPVLGLISRLFRRHHSKRPA